MPPETELRRILQRDPGTLVYGLDNMPADESLRQRLNAEFDNDSGFESLKKIMREKVPDDFEKWHQHRRRLLRAYEVFLLTGQPFTSCILS